MWQTNLSTLGRAFAAIATAMLWSPSDAKAQAAAWTIQWENDAFPEWGDDDYTNGLRISADFTKAIWWGPWARRYRDCKEPDGDKPCRRTTMMFGQNFYTPRNIAISEVQEDERPYAAWLYVGFAARLAQSKRLRTAELQIGTTGKSAQGEAVQKWWHSRPWVNATEPKGWAHEVKPVPGAVGIVATWDDKFAVERKTEGSNPFVYADAISYYRLMLGNVHTNAAAGATLRLGYNLQRRWAEKIGPTVIVASMSQTTLPPERRFEFNVFSGIETRAVGWNALLQHGTYTPRHLASVSRGVVDLETGIAAGYRRISGGFRWVWRSPEFDGARWNRFAGLFVTWASKPP